MIGLLKLMADAVAATRRAGGGFSSADTQSFLEHEAAIASPTLDPAVYAKRVDLFRQGVWDYMFDGYSTYWKKKPTPRLPLLKLNLQLLDWTQFGGFPLLARILERLPWNGILGPFSYGQKPEFDEPSLEVLHDLPNWQFAQENGEVVIVADQDHAFLCEIAQQIAAVISAHVALASLPVRIVEVPGIVLVLPVDLEDHLAGLRKASQTTLCAVLIVGWTTGFKAD